MNVEREGESGQYARTTSVINRESHSQAQKFRIAPYFGFSTQLQPKGPIPPCQTFRSDGMTVAVTSVFFNTFSWKICWWRWCLES